MCYLFLVHDGMNPHAHYKHKVPEAKLVQKVHLWHLVVLLLALSAWWLAELNNVEIYKCSHEVQESSGRHQHRKQVWQMWWGNQSCTCNAQTSHGCDADAELQQTHKRRVETLNDRVTIILKRHIKGQIVFFFFHEYFQIFTSFNQLSLYACHLIVW